MNHGTFFSGIGGPEHAAERMGWNNVFHCEINPFGQMVLKSHFPGSESFEDIKKTNFKKFHGTIDVLSGGWPCQDNSNAHQCEGGKKGLQGERSGLFFEFARGIDEIRPFYVVAENVSNVIDINGGEDFLTILKELARMGYNAEWRNCYAAEVGAPHKRKRTFIVAYPRSFRLENNQSFFAYVQAAKGRKGQPREIAGTTVMVGERWDFEPPILCLPNGVPEGLDVEAISPTKYISESLKAYGNSIVPEIPYLIFKAIKELHPLVIKSIENEKFSR